MMSLGEGLTPGAVAWVCIGVYSILDGNINYTLDLVGTAKDANWRITDPKSTLFRPTGARNLGAWVKIKAEIEKSSSTLLPILLKESSEWHNVDDGYESGVGKCQLESSPEL